MGISPLLEGYFPEGSFVWLTFCHSACVMILMRADDPLRGQVGGGPWKSRVFGSQTALAYLLYAISQGPKNSQFPGPASQFLICQKASVIIL